MKGSTVTTKTRTYKINDDGWSIAGCAHIYAPAGQAGEYAKLAANPYKGCGHASRTRLPITGV
jgi:N-acetylglutamate synthase-like GNAT family acetyltransferase